VFPHLCRHPDLLWPHLPSSTFYIAAAGLGWFVHPILAVGIFVFIVGYYAWTSQGIHAGH
jgi:hypothetical protein